MKSVIRAVAGAAAFVGLAVLTLNIERIAQANKLDQLLLPDPGKATGLLTLAQHPLSVIAAALLVGFGLGLWTDSGVRRFTAKRPRKVSWEETLGSRMVEMARHLGSIDDNGVFYDGHDRRTAAAKLLLLLEDIESRGIPIDKDILADGPTGDQLLNYLTHVGMCLGRRDLAKAMLVARQFASGNQTALA